MDPVSIAVLIGVSLVMISVFGSGVALLCYFEQSRSDPDYLRRRRDVLRRRNLAEYDRRRRSAAPVRPLPLVEKKREPAADDEKTTIETKSCAVCLDNLKRVAATPCGHYGWCFGCSKRLKKCPVCRASISGFLRVWDA